MTVRHRELKKMLETLRDQIVEARRCRVRELHDKGESDVATVADSLDRAEADMVDDLDAALLQMATETLAKVDEALGRLDAGMYGVCADCRGDIPFARLNALPFALRCRTCEARAEARTTGHHLHSAWHAQA